MPAYIPITELETDPGAPGTSELWKKWRDNPLAIAEGSTNALYILSSWHPYNSAVVGDGNTGRIWSFAVNGLVSAFETPNLVDGYEYRILMWGMSSNHPTGVSNVQFQFRRQTDGVLNAATALIELDTSSRTVSLNLEATHCRRVQRYHMANGASVDIGAVSAVQNIRISLSNGSFDSGEVFLYRRRVYA